MAVTSPNIDTATAVAGSQRDAETARLNRQRQIDLNRVLSQYGSVDDLIKAVESGQYDTDQALLKNAGAVAGANQGTRYADQTRTEEELIRNQSTADRAAAQGRADANAKADRESAALKAVDDAYSGYDDKFFGDYAANIVQSNLPGLRDTYKEKGRVTDAALSQKGIGMSSAAARTIGRLRGAQVSDEASLAAQASDAAETLRASLDASRANAVKEALAAAGIQQNTPVAGATIADILASRAAAGAGSGAPGLPAAPPALSKPAGSGAHPSVPAATPPATPAPPAGGGGSGGSGGSGDDRGTIFNSDPRGGQIAGVGEDGGWSYAHYPGTDGYDDFANGTVSGTGAVTPIQIPTVKTAASTAARQGRIMEAPTSLADVGISMPLQPAPTNTGHTAATPPPMVDNMKATRNRPKFGPPGGASGNASYVGAGSGPGTLSPNDPSLQGTGIIGRVTPAAAPGAYGTDVNMSEIPEALGGTMKATDFANRTDQNAAGFGVNVPVELGGVLPSPAPGQTAPRKAAAAQPATMRQALAGVL